MASSYCDFCNQLPTDTSNPNKHYHDNEYGFELHDDNQIFGRLILEINQAGLSWTTILNKRDNFYQAFDAFDISKIAHYTQEKRDNLLQDAGIIRNRLKVDAVIYNAQQVLHLQQEYGSFKNWIELHLGLSLPEWVKLFKKHFKFVGGEIVNEFLMSMGYLPGAHQTDCEIYMTKLSNKIINK